MGSAGDGPFLSEDELRCYAPLSSPGYAERADEHVRRAVTAGNAWRPEIGIVAAMKAAAAKIRESGTGE